MYVQFVKNNSTAHTAPVGYDSPDVKFNEFLTTLLGSDVFAPINATTTNTSQKTTATEQTGHLETVQRVFNKAKGAQLPSIGKAVSIGAMAFIKAALVTPFYAICRLFGMPKLSFTERAAIIGGTRLYHGYVKPAFDVNG